MRLKDKVAIITGGSRGIGYVCVGAGYAQKTELCRFRVERFLG